MTVNTDGVVMDRLKNLPWRLGRGKSSARRSPEGPPGESGRPQGQVGAPGGEPQGAVFAEGEGHGAVARCWVPAIV